MLVSSMSNRSIVVGYNYNTNLDTSKLVFRYYHIGVSRGSVQLVVDWCSHTLYWTDSLYKWVVAASTKSSYTGSLYKIVVNTHLEAPDGIALDPFEG